MYSLTPARSTVVEDLHKRAGQDTKNGIAFMYLKYNQPDQTFENDIESLLQQLLAPNGVPIPIRELNHSGLHHPSPQLTPKNTFEGSMKILPPTDLWGERHDRQKEKRRVDTL